MELRRHGLVGDEDLSFPAQLTMLLAAASYSSLTLWAKNSLEFPHPERILPIVGIVWLLVLAGSSLAHRLGATRSAATGGGVIWALTLTMGGLAVGRLGFAGTLLGGLVVGVLAVILMTRLKEISAVRYSLIGLTFLLATAPVGLLAADLLEQATEVDLAVPSSPVSEALDVRPDIYLVVVDGFVGVDGSREIFGIAQPEWVKGLEEEGFQVPRSGWASYPITIASLPSLFDMDYPIEPNVDGNRALTSALVKKLGGANRLVSILKENGYTTTMIEAGWAWSHCGQEYDTCVESAYLDEGTFAILRRSIFGESILTRWASPFTQGAKHAMSRLLEQADSVPAKGSGPRFVFGHLMAPHPPMFLNSDCVVEFQIERAGAFFRSPFADFDYRRDRYFEQADCVTTFMYEFSSHVPADDVIVFVADHGTDSQNQLLRPGSDWTIDDSVERLSSLIAVRSEMPCDFEDSVFLSNLMRVLLDCIGDRGSSAAVEARMFTGGLRLDSQSAHFSELSQEEVSEVLRGSGGRDG